jgi:hypothetical protein
MQDEITGAEPNDGLAEALASIPPEPASTGDDGGDKGGGDGVIRDERGRFAKAEAEAEAAAAEADKGAKEGNGEERDTGAIPAWRLREIREERDRIAAEKAAAEARAAQYERELAALRQHQRREQEAAEAPARPDPIADPEGYDAWINQTLDQRTRAIEAQFRNQWVNLTFAEEHEKHGETFEKAMAALEAVRNPQVVAEIREAVNPGKALMRWYRRHTALAEVGDDLEGYQKRFRDKLKKDPDFRKEFMAELEAEARGGTDAGRSSSNVTDLPSVNRAPGGPGRQTPGSLGSSDREIFENLNRRRG